MRNTVRFVLAFPIQLATICQVSFVSSILLLVFVCSVMAGGQATGTHENLRTKRDEEALSLLQSTVQALSASDGRTISDYRLEGLVTRWDGQETSGTFSQIGVGAADRRTAVSIGGNPVFSLLVLNDAGIIQFENNNEPRNVPNEVAMEASYYFFVNLLQEAISNQHVDVVSIPSPNNSPDIGHIRITRHMAIWVPAMGSLGEARFDIYIDRDSKTVTKIVNSARLESNLSQTIPHTISFSDYRREQGWSLPHEIDETYAGAPHNHFTLEACSLNKGLTVSDLKSK
jgi:hypothetical protein